MLRRKVTEKLAEWKNKKDHKCLLVRGARQTGKSFSVSLFASEKYDEVVVINFKETPALGEIFYGNLDVDSMILAMRFRFPEKTLKPEKTLIFLDEIQECAEAITSLKFWALDNRYDVIASGSMLGIDYKRPSSYPVGYVDYIDMYGLDFEEFLWSRGISDDMILSLKSMFLSRSPVPPAIHSQMMMLFRTYMAIGGMPEVVQKFADTDDFREASLIQHELLLGYRYDIAHYASTEEKIKAEKCYLSLTSQLLGKENHKFQYKEVEKKGKAQKYFSSLQWLMNADIIRICNNVSSLAFDLHDYIIEDNFRAYATDLSMLMSMRDIPFMQQIVENTISGTSRGGMYECAIADMFIKKGCPVWFYRNESKKQELDFLLQQNGTVLPVEVKSSNTRATSLNSIMRAHPEIPLAYKLIDGNVGKSDNRIISIPLYMSMFLMEA